MFKEAKCSCHLPFFFSVFLMQQNMLAQETPLVFCSVSTTGFFFFFCLAEIVSSSVSSIYIFLLSYRAQVSRDCQQSYFGMLVIHLIYTGIPCCKAVFFFFFVKCCAFLYLMLALLLRGFSVVTHMSHDHKLADHGEENVFNPASVHFRLC